MLESGKLAAMKRVPIQDDLELDDFMVEIDILAECKHRNIVGLHEAYFYDQALWVSSFSAHSLEAGPMDGSVCVCVCVCVCGDRSTLSFVQEEQWMTL